jgi:hypothetical protein
VLTFLQPRIDRRSHLKWPACDQPALTLSKRIRKEQGPVDDVHPVEGKLEDQRPLSPVQEHNNLVDDDALFNGRTPVDRERWLWGDTDRRDRKEIGKKLDAVDDAADKLLWSHFTEWDSDWDMVIKVLEQRGL